MPQPPRVPSNPDPVRPRSLSTLSYRSRVVEALTAADLERLASAARDRNHAEGVSTLVLFDGEQVFQWLEGPAEALGRIWASVQRDPRHTAIEVLDPQHPTPLRLFGDFDLRFATSTPTGADRPAPVDVEAAMLGELVRFALAGEAQGLAARPGEPVPGEWVQTALDGDLFEATARRLGDLWQSDACDEFELALGLGRLQGCLRRAGARRAARPVLGGAPIVLVTPLPGESHLLGAALDADAFWRAGWHPQVEFPADAAALRRLLAGRWFDVLDLSLSAAFRREHWLPRMTKMIAAARTASRNPALVVVTGGRVFGERPAAAGEVGADAAIASASLAEQTVVRALAACELRRPTTMH